MVTIKPGTPIQRRSDIPESERTEKRDATADVIDELWPAEKTKIAEEADCSRTHVDNVLATYYEPVDPSTASPSTNGDMDISINVSGELDPQLIKIYLKGYLDAVEDLSDDESEVGAADVGDLFSDGGTVVS